jgi:hypothetical protein
MKVRKSANAAGRSPTLLLSAAEIGRTGVWRLLTGCTAEMACERRLKVAAVLPSPGGGRGQNWVNLMTRRRPLTWLKTMARNADNPLPQTLDHSTSKLA